MTSVRRVTDPMLDVLEVLVGSSLEGAEVHGWALTKAVGRSGPTVYGVLDRLEDMSWVHSRWEDSPLEGKPRRRVYRLTPNGTIAAQSLLAERRPADPAARTKHPTRWIGPRALPGAAQ